MSKKLHELLAAESVASTQADKCRTDLLNTFEKKRHLFTEKLVTFVPSAEGEVATTEEQSSLQSTVKQELAWIAGIWEKALDAAYQIDQANTLARADVVLDDGTVIATGVPATALLQLEKRATEMLQLVAAVPTLDPSKGFTLDAQRRDGVYKSREERKTRTKKTQRPLVLYPATPEHPAQTQLVTEDVPVGTITEVQWSGLITPGEKATMMERAEELRRALKQARARANDTACPEQTIGAALLGYVLGTGATKRV